MGTIAAKYVEHADYKDKLNLEITTGGDWDLVFDASWVQLKTLAAEGYYADLSEYFNNDEYPGLKAAFSEETMEANKWFGSMCYIPLYETYGNGIPCIYYRQDLADEWGIGDVDSYDKLTQYWDKAKENGLTPLSARDTRGFFQLMSLRGESYEGAAQAGIQSWAVGGMQIWCYINDGELVSYAVEGSGDEAFKDFPDGWNTDFAEKRYETFAQWQDAGYISADSLSEKDDEPAFNSGLAASIIGTYDDISKRTTNLQSGELGAFVYVDSVRNMEQEAIPTTYAGNNGLAIPKSSTKIDSTMKFLDWLFSSQENHDLFQLGIEGKDFEYVGENQYTALTSYSSDFPGYGFTWNPNYALLSSSLEGQWLDYKEYELEPTTFVAQPVCGFNFDQSDVDLSTSIALVKSITDKVSKTKLHGIASDGDTTYDSMSEMLKTNYEQAMENDGDKVVDEFVKQLKEYLASK